jgi:TRAP-type C4-dicarboxylate transport system permease small subunit
MMAALLGLAGLVTVVLVQVFGRYVLNDTPTWAESLALLLVLYVTMLGAAVGVRDAGHIGLDSLLVLAPEWLRGRLELLIHALVAGFGLAMSYCSALLALSDFSYRIPTLGISEAVRQVPGVAAGLLIALFCVEHIVARLRGRKVRPAWP